MLTRSAQVALLSGILFVMVAIQVTSITFSSANSQTSIGVHTYFRTGGIEIENDSNSRVGLSATFWQILTLTNYNSSAWDIQIPAYYLSVAIPSNVTVSSSEVNDTIGNNFTTISIAGISANTTEYGNRPELVTVGSFSHYTVELQVVCTYNVFNFLGPFLARIDLTTIPPFTENWTVSVSPKFTITNYSRISLTSENTQSNEITWSLFQGSPIEIWVDFLPFHSTDTNESSWTDIGYLSSEIVTMSISKVYPEIPTANIQFQTETVIPKFVNGFEFSPNAIIVVPIPTFSDLGQIYSISDQNGSLFPLSSPPTNLSVSHEGYYYVNYSAAVIDAFPRPLYSDGNYIYNVTASYSSGIKGAFVTSGLFSERQSIFIIPKNLGAKHPLYLSLTVQVPPNVTIESVTPTSNFTQSTSLSGQSTLLWKILKPAYEFQTIHFTINYGINSVSKELGQESILFVVSLVLLLLVIFARRIIKKSQYGEILIPLVLGSFLLFFANFMVSNISFMEQGGRFLWESVVGYVATGVVYGVSIAILVRLLIKTTRVRKRKTAQPVAVAGRKSKPD